MKDTPVTHYASAPMPSGYLDNCIVPTGVVKGQLPEVEATALRTLQRLHDRGDLALWTSPVVKEEIAKMPVEHRQPFDDLYAMYANLPVVAEEWRMPKMITSLRSGLTSGPVVRDELLGRLIALLPHELDARHIYWAAKHGLDFFITRDEKSILRYMAAILAMTSVEALLPSQVVAKLDFAAGA